MIDTIKTIPAYKRWADLVRVAATGYKEVGLFEIGPIYKFISSNPIEGFRLRFGGQTSNKFSTRLVLSGYSAYGFKDERFKYGGTLRYFTSKDPRQYFGVEYTKDVEQLGVSANAFANDNVFATLLRRQQALLLNDVEMEKSISNTNGNPASPTASASPIPNTHRWANSTSRTSPMTRRRTAAAGSTTPTFPSTSASPTTNVSYRGS